MAGLYLHFPFCRSRCIYCDFYSTTFGKEVMEAYARAMQRELALRCTILKGTRVHTIYIGGGTPSLMPTQCLSSLFDTILRHYSICSDAEVTIEANPDDVTPEWLDCLTSTPINRISMGAQSFSDERLRFLRRRHDAKQIKHAVRLCKAANFRNISIDLIYGLPGQSLGEWNEDVSQALSLGIQHLSAYALSYEDGTALDRLLKKGVVTEADEEMSRQMYQHLLNETKQAGFVHYEISNFSLPGFHSRHNSSYWQGLPYLGIGAGAHSYDGHRERRANLPDLKTYLAATEDVPHETETLSDDECYDEFVMTRLRTNTGIPLELLSSDDRNYCLSMAEPHIQRHLLICQRNHLRLTPEGIFTSNDIISDLMK